MVKSEENRPPTAGSRRLMSSSSVTERLYYMRGKYDTDLEGTEYMC